MVEIKKQGLYDGAGSEDTPEDTLALKDYGKSPTIVNIDALAKTNDNYRLALWTGEYMQVTLMSIPVGQDVGLEIHEGTEQFFRVESGRALVEMGASKDKLEYREEVTDDFAFVVPKKTWHNVTNIGNTPLKLYSIYAPPHHEYGTVQKTRKDGE